VAADELGARVSELRDHFAARKEAA
jgi:hypothetical protein